MSNEYFYGSTIQELLNDGYTIEISQKGNIVDRVLKNSPGWKTVLTPSKSKVYLELIDMLEESFSIILDMLQNPDYIDLGTVSNKLDNLLVKVKVLKKEVGNG